VLVPGATLKPVCIQGAPAPARADARGRPRFILELGKLIHRLKELAAIAAIIEGHLGLRFGAFRNVAIEYSGRRYRAKAKLEG
jgi:hypothetical protein